MEEKLKQLKAILAEVADLNAASALLGWDQQVCMPAGAAESRGLQLGTLGSLAHDKFTSAEVGLLLDALEPYAAQLDPDSDDARLIRVTRREYTKQTRVPAEMIIEMAKVTSVAHQVWFQARQENNFPKFQPYLERVVELRREYAHLFEPYEHVYDPLLDDFEPGLKTADVQAIFEALRPQQVTLLKEIAAQPEIDDSFLHLPYDEQKQWDFGVEIITQFGYDWDHGRQDKSAHPFTQNIGIDDARITTRILPNYLSSAMFSTFHECGHALYELGVDHALARTPLAGGASLALHESQSRLWENLVGRSYPFWQRYYSRLQEYFPEQLKGISMDQFYRGINKVQPSLIRTEADEATYNLHVMLRLELEIAMIAGKIEIKDLPEVWKARMQEYLGVTPPDDKDGVLQDVHWSGGMIGYFSTYALGNLISAQLWERLHQDIPELDDQIQAGEFRTLLGWLRQNVHRHGAKFEPQELVQRITGSKIDAAPYMRYLRQKFGMIYGI